MAVRGSGSSPPPAHQQLTRIRELGGVNAALKPNAEFYLVSMRWWNAWKAYVGDTDDGDFDSGGGSSAMANMEPGPIDNSDIILTVSSAGEEGAGRLGAAGLRERRASLSEDGLGHFRELKPHLMDGRDYVMVTPPAWSCLIEWFTGGPAIVRRVIALGDRGELQVEVYPVRLVVERWTGVAVPPVAAGGSLQYFVSRVSKVQDLLERVCADANVSSSVADAAAEFVAEGNARLWQLADGARRELINADDTIDDACLQPGQNLELEVKVDGVYQESREEADETAVAVEEAEVDDDRVVDEITAAVEDITGDWAPVAPGTPCADDDEGSGVRVLGKELMVVDSSGDGDNEGEGENDGGESEARPLLLTDGSFGLSSMGTGPRRLGGLGMTLRSASGDPARRGLAGLQNLGNTCFMNSALQCLAHTPQLVDFFTGDYAAEINATNPLGMRGELAAAFGDLLRQLWSGTASVVVPRQFKQTLARFAPQFSGYQQHDSQELLAFLLDGLHEDLNRVITKPYIELKEADGRPDALVAEESWSNHRARNDSIIVDTCQGQFKSTLICPDCSKQSVTFDPFMYLSLPLPANATMQHLKVTVVYADGSAAPVEYGVLVGKNAQARELRERLRQVARVPAGCRLVLTEIFHHKVHKVFGAQETLMNVRHEDLLYAYVLPGARGRDIFLLHTVDASVPMGLVAAPLAVSVPEDATGKDLHEAVAAAISPFQTSQRLEAAVSADAAADAVPRATEDVELEEVTSTSWTANGAAPDAGAAAGGAEAASEVEAPEDSAGGLRDDSDAMSVKDDAADGDEDDAMNASGQLKEGEDEAEFRISVENGNTDASTRWGNWPANIMSNGRLGPSSSLPYSIFRTNESGLARGPMILPTDSLPPHRQSGFFHWEVFALVWDSKADEHFDRRLITTPPKDESAVPPPPEAQKRNAPSLYACVETFLKSEPLGIEDMWYCPKCKQHKQATKKLDLWKLPEILVVHLKRFSYSRWSRDKLDVLVDFPVRDFDLRPYVTGQQAQEQLPVYELYAVSNHYGGLGGGHYTAYARHHVNRHWYLFDDSSLHKCSEGEVVSSAAYVLFFQRQSAAPP